MSYVRWSSTLPITETCKECGREPRPKPATHEEAIDQYIKLHTEDMARWERRKAEGKRALCELCTSPWYIYWDCQSGETRDSQILAVWSNAIDEHPYYDYPTLRDIANRGAWSEIAGHAESGNPFDVLAECVKEWLAEVESDFNKPALVAASE